VDNENFVQVLMHQLPNPMLINLILDQQVEVVIVVHLHLNDQVINHVEPLQPQLLRLLLHEENFVHEFVAIKFLQN
jgi:hypothetical protein